MRWRSRLRRGIDHVVEILLRRRHTHSICLAREAAVGRVVQLHEGHGRVGEQRVQPGGDLSTLLAAADAALYRAKAAGRDRLACATPAEISRLPIADDAVPV